jgi:hypothetical protein
VLRRILSEGALERCLSLCHLPWLRNSPASGPFAFGMDLKAGFDPGHNLNGA